MQRRSIAGSRHSCENEAVQKLVINLCDAQMSDGAQEQESSLNREAQPLSSGNRRIGIHKS